MRMTTLEARSKASAINCAKSATSRQIGMEPYSRASPTCGVFVVPDGKENGAIETLCRQSVNDSPVARCVDEYLNCLKANKCMESINAEKSFVHAYLAATDNPTARVGEGALRGVWNFSASSFRNIIMFIRELQSQEM